MTLLTLLHGMMSPAAIAEITVAGFKSIEDEQSIEIRPLTILAGANSSGKSSIMQPLLLLKQTLEASYDPGALLLDGPNVKFSSAEQMFFVGVRGRKSSELLFKFQIQPEVELELVFGRGRRKGIDVLRMILGHNRPF